MNTQDLSPSGWTGWISLQSKGLSRVFSNTTVQKHQLGSLYTHSVDFEKCIMTYFCHYNITSVQFSSVTSCVWFLATPWTAVCQASLSITNSQSLPELMSIKSVMPSNHLILCRPLLLLPTVRASESFQVYIIAPNTLYFTCQATFPHHQPTENHWSFYLFPFLDII